jgi:hypothetical protein
MLCAALRLATIGAIVMLLAGCRSAAGRPATERETPEPVAATVVIPTPSSASSAAKGPEIDLGPIPVTAADPTEGDASAPVTIVAFWGFELDKSHRATTALLALSFQPTEVRIVFKHRASPRGMRSAHHEAAAVFRVGGMPAFSRYMKAIAKTGSFAERRERGLSAAHELITSSLSPTPEDTRKVDDDVALAAKLGVGVPPVIFINGRRVEGEETATSLEPLILDELAAAKAAHPDGRLPADWYARRTAAALAQAAAAPRPPPTVADEAAKVVYGAKHLVVQWAGTKRSKQTRTKAEAKQLAARALAELKAGAAFEDVARKYSDEPGAQNSGGNLGRFQRGHMDPIFGDTVASLTVGAMSGIIETQFGFHIVVRTE